MNRIDRITDIRGFNRFYTNILGLLDQHILDSGYSLTEARVIFELSKMEHFTANQLCQLLKIDRSYMSRTITKLEKSGLIKRSASLSDGRNIEIRLSDKGHQVFHQLNDRSNQQVEQILTTLSDDECRKVTDAMGIIKKYLMTASVDVKIRPYQKSDIEYVIDRQLSLYEAERGFTSEIWEKYLVQGVLELVENFDEAKECLFILECNGEQAGCVAIKQVEAGIAQFRYFFLEPELRGLGLGRQLIQKALEFCQEKDYNQVFLWTVSAQETARFLYQKAGFKITETHATSDWGTQVIEERWDLKL
ncbi:MAG: helix-turn-helix domain-containing GNAT family N-acetyltransferase [Streptococcaceae bacterium]|jgi:DNA-binding MarR family transcriptional regulator/GNAT superfamily N-acetyltransferase|nr:helix-turn-helix domain-containing GNAT family N-acetyltransferase [Streptococcaceae bacterium]MCH4176792.1 helix-turn-helix domain-containing GNAT family N-acetyltransferase [Streptococcaceae bacterium]